MGILNSKAMGTHHPLTHIHIRKTQSLSPHHRPDGLVVPVTGTGRDAVTGVAVPGKQMGRYRGGDTPTEGRG